MGIEHLEPSDFDLFGKAFKELAGNQKKQVKHSLFCEETARRFRLSKAETRQLLTGKMLKIKIRDGIIVKDWD